MKYTAKDGAVDVFSVNEVTGEIKTIVAIAASGKERTFSLHIAATDGTDTNDTAIIDITVCRLGNCHGFYSIHELYAIKV